MFTWFLLHGIVVKKIVMNIFKKGTLILIFLHDTSAPMVQSNYLNLHTVPSPSGEKKQNKVNDCKFNFSYLYHHPVTGLVHALQMIKYGHNHHHLWHHMPEQTKISRISQPCIKTVHHCCPLLSSTMFPSWFIILMAKFDHDFQCQKAKLNRS